jgi:DNA-binding IclR family transcriptional regulator
VTARTVLEEQLALARLEGWASTLEEFEIGLNAIAAPIRDHAGDVVGSVSVSGPAYRLDPVRMRALAPDLVDGAARIGALLGHNG